jgi:hypothetical protein
VTQQTIPRTDNPVSRQRLPLQAKRFSINKLLADDKGKEIAPRHHQVGVPLLSERVVKEMFHEKVGVGSRSSYGLA